MLITNPHIINSCRVCRSPNQDGDYECLYESASQHEDKPQLSEAGILYENLLDISLNMGDYYPQFLCNSCDLQMKLFKKLKDKAYKTLEYLQNLYEHEINNTKGEEEQQHSVQASVDNEQINVESLEEYVSLENEYQDNLTEECQESTNGEYAESVSYEHQVNDAIEYPESETHEYQSKSAEEYPEAANNEYQTNAADDQYTEICNNDCQADGLYPESSNNEYQTNANEAYLEEKLTLQEHIEKQSLYPTEDLANTLNTAEQDSNEPAINIESLTNELKLEIDATTSDLKYHFSTTATTENSSASNDNIPPEITLDLQTAAIDKSDYVTEIYELLEDENKCETNAKENNDNIVEYDIYTEENSQTSSIAFSEVEYVIEEEMVDESQHVGQKLTAEKRRRPNNANKRRKVESTGKRREYKCEPCQLEFKNMQEQKQHRTEVHDEKYPCKVCAKELKSLPALHQHLKLHSEQPAFKCEICRKTFNQKAHYQYHMNRHNNVRNFKCSECEKAFISKADLKVHMRCHTGQRPYVCNICGKDYLMMEHLKTHLLTHTEQYFQCDICKHKFATHKTLRMHVKTIHEDEPRFKCNFCSKPFRRKHHLEYHLKLHQKNVKFLDSRYEVIDDPAAEAGYNTDDLVDQELVDDPGFIALNDDVI